MKISGIIFLFMLSSNLLQAQCFCADIYFQLAVKDLQFKGKAANFSFELLEFVGSGGGKRPFHRIKNDIQDDTLRFSYPTGGGINLLKFALHHKDQDKSMIISVKNLSYDLPYHMDLRSFKPGSYLFDWDMISTCMYENPQQKKIKCEGKSFELASRMVENGPVIKGIFRIRKHKDFLMKSE